MKIVAELVPVFDLSHRFFEEFVRADNLWIFRRRMKYGNGPPGMGGGAS
jgi:hypothetical protein